MNKTLSCRPSAHDEDNYNNVADENGDHYDSDGKGDSEDDGDDDDIDYGDGDTEALMTIIKTMMKVTMNIMERWQ